MYFEKLGDASSLAFESRDEQAVTTLTEAIDQHPTISQVELLNGKHTFYSLNKQ